MNSESHGSAEPEHLLTILTSYSIISIRSYQLGAVWCKRRCKAKVQAAGGKALESTAWEAPELPDAAWTNSVNRKPRAPWGYTNITSYILYIIL